MMRKLNLFLCLLTVLPLLAGKDPIHTSFSNYAVEKGTVNVFVDYSTINGLQNGDTYRAVLSANGKIIDMEVTCAKNTTSTQMFSFTDAIEGEPGEVVDYNVTIEIGDETYSTAGTMHFLAKDHGRKIVMEEGTGTWCGYCTRGAYGLELMSETYKDSFIGIAVHFGDVMTFGSVYTDGMKEGEPTIGLPCSRIDRSGHLFDPYFEVWQQGVGAAALSEPSPVTIDLEGMFIDNYNAIDLTSTIDCEYIVPEHEYGMVFVLTENNVCVPNNPLYCQNNNYGNGHNGEMGPYSALPGLIPADQMIYSHVARIISSYTGADCPVNFKDNHAEVSYRLPLPSYLLQRCEIACVAMLTDLTTGEIVNANVVKASELGIAKDEPLFLCDFRYAQLPRDFLCFDLDENVPDAASGIAKGQGWALGGEEGDFYAYSTSWYTPAGVADDWLISPAIKIPANSDLTLSWEGMSSSANYKDSYEVRLSDGNAVTPDNFTNPAVSTVTDENPEWTEHQISINNFASQELRFAFRNITSNGEMLRIRNIKLVDNNNNAVGSLASVPCKVQLDGANLHVSAPGQFKLIITDMAGYMVANTIGIDYGMVNLENTHGVVVAHITGNGYTHNVKLFVK
ncbi:MAG: hypothetical protein HDR88_17335 [Bacteroides sp.]|nr:hypothetical protein [Bacteroides sp.]